MASSPPHNLARFRWCHVLVAAALVLACAGAQAAARVRIATLALPGVSLADVQAELQPGADGRPQLSLEAGKVSVPALGWRDAALAVTGQPQRADANAWRFVGHVRTRNTPGGALSDADVTIFYDRDGGTLEVDVGQGKTGVHALMPLDQASHLQIDLAALPLAWLRGLVAAVWPDGRLQGGTLAGRVAIDLGAGSTRVSGRVELAGASLDSKDGSIATQGLGAAGSFRIEEGLPATRFMFDGTLKGGKMLLGPFYAQLPDHATNLHVGGTLGLLGARIGTLDYDDRDALRLAGSLAFNRKGALEELDMRRFAASFPAAYTRYGTTLVQALAGLSQLDTSGNLSGSLRIDRQGVRALDLSADGLSVVGDGRGLAVANLNGGIDWRSGTSRPATSLSWDALALDRLVFGPGHLGLRDEAGVLTLQAPLTTTFFGGSFRVARLAWRPDAARAQRLSAAFSVSDVDLAAFCKALGLPAFQGKLGGAVPDLSYRGDELAFAGGLSMHVFDGAVSVTDLAIRDPFGVDPQVTTDVDLQQLDLAQLTNVFDFGQITGRLDGYIHGLKVVGWKPVAFAARLDAYGGGKISQHAIQSLTRVGGGGIAGGLQGMALRLFKTFNYAKIGLGCTLTRGVCSMSGIVPEPDPDQSGYTIVEGSGLPHITVIGHERAVDWATLVSRLKAATEGGGPVVR